MKGLVATIGMILVLLGLSTPAASTTVVRLGLPVSVESRQWQTALEMAKEIELPASSGIEIHLEALADQKITLEKGIEQNMVDGGLAMIPEFQALHLGREAYSYSIPFTFRSIAEVEKVRNGLDELVLSNLSDGEMEAIAIMGLGFTYLLSSRPLATPDDWRQLHIWQPANQGFTGSLMESVKLVGLTTVEMEANAVFDKLQEGVVDSVIVPPAVAVLKRWHRTMRQLFNLPITYSYGIWVLGNATFSRLNAMEQDLVRQYVRQLNGRMESLIADRNLKSMEVLERWEIQQIAPDNTMLEQWRQWATTVVQGLDPAYLPPESIQDKLELLLRP